MGQTDVALIVLGIALVPVGIFLMTWETCVAVVGGLCVGRERVYEAPGLALLVLGVLLFLTGLALLVTGKEGK